MQVEVKGVEFFLSDLHTRIPFRFGVVTMTWAPHMLCRVRLRVQDGPEVEGCSADFLPPKWFDKDPKKSFADNIEELRDSAVAAADAFQHEDPNTVFELWRRVYDRRVGLDLANDPDSLTRGFGVALLERAVMDATCRAAGVSFFEALRSDLFGFRPETVHPSLAGWDLAASLGDTPKGDILLRHTVGLIDPLLAADVPDSERISDGLPQSLDEDIDTYGLRAFKVKLCGDPEKDLERIQILGGLFGEKVPEGLIISVDGNEQFQDLAVLVDEFERAGRTPEGRLFLDALVLIEQPLMRAGSFDPKHSAALADLTAIAPVIIDEADYGVGAFPLAVERGYRGISIKNCKGVFRALLNRGICDVKSRELGVPLFQSPEDLTNVPVLALQQDLATAAALGCSHIERNGHHYFRGLDHLPLAERKDALAHHSDLYCEKDGGCFVSINQGRLRIGSLQCPGYGVATLPSGTAERTPLAEWHLPRERAAE